MGYRETQGKPQTPLFEGEETDFRWLLLPTLQYHPRPFDVFSD